MIKIGILDFTSNNDNSVIKFIKKLGCEIKKISLKNFEIRMLKELSMIIILSDGIDDYNIIRNWIYLVEKQIDVCIILSVKKEISVNQLDSVYLKLGVAEVINENSELEKIESILKPYLYRKRYKKYHGKFELFKISHYILIENKKKVYLTELEFLLMEHLIDNVGKILEHTKLIKYLWNKDYCITRTQLANLILNLSKKLTYKDNKYIRTVDSKGYVLLEDE